MLPGIREYKMAIKLAKKKERWAWVSMFLYSAGVALSIFLAMKYKDDSLWAFMMGGMMWANLYFVIVSISDIRINQKAAEILVVEMEKREALK